MKKIILVCILCTSLILNFLTLTGLTKDTVVIIGSEPECITAAVTASKLGYDVTLISEANRAGGLLIDGMLTALDINYDDHNNVLHNGFFKEFLEACSNGYNVDFEQTETFFNQILSKYPIRTIYNAKDIKPVIRNNKIIGVSYKSNDEDKKQYCNFIIDGSSEAAFSRKLGVSYKKGRSEFGRPNVCAAATLIFSVENVDWAQVTSFLANDHDRHTGSKGNAAWGFNTMYQCPTSNEKLQMRGLNLSRQNDGSVVINALLIFGVDPTQKDSKDEAYLLAKTELPSIVDYLSEHCKGFEKATLYKIADTLYIREGVRIVGENTLTGNDVFGHVHFPNTIAYGSYPIDLQAAQKGEYGSALCGKCLYSIPLGCMIPKGIENVLVIGRSASFDIIAHGSTRTVPVLMSMAENGVFAMDYSIKNNISIHNLNGSLKDLEAFYKYINKLNHFERLILPKNHLETNWYYPNVHDLISKGYFGLGYSDYNFDSTNHTKKTLSTVLGLFASNSPYKLSKPCKSFIHGIDENVKTEDLCKVLSYMFEDNFNTLEELYQKSIIDKTIYEHTQHTAVLSHAEIVAVLDCALKKINCYTEIMIYNDSKDIIYE